MRRRALSQLEAGGEPWDIAGARLTNSIFAASKLGVDPGHVFFKSDGTQMYVPGAAGDNSVSGAPIVVFNLSTAWNISTASYSYTAELSNTSTTTIANMYLSDDGLNLFIDSSVYLYQYALSTAWDLSTASFIRSITHTDVNSTLLFSARTFFKPDGTKMFVLGDVFGGSYVVVEYTLSTAWNISTKSAVRQYSNIAIYDDYPAGLFFKSDGTKMYVLGYSNDFIREFTLSTAWSLSNVSLTNSYDPGTSLSRGLYFRPNGLNLYFTDFGTDLIYQYTMTSAWNTSTASQTRTFNPYTREGPDVIGVDFKPDGSKLYPLNSFSSYPGNDFWSYDLSTAWSLEGATYTPNSGVTLSGTFRDVFFKSDGTRVYLLDSSSIYEYSLGTAWNLSTLSYVRAKSIISQESDVNSLFFKSDGTKAYIIGPSGDAVHQYTLGTAWDISTLTYINSFSVSAQETAPRGLFFKPDGTKFYIGGNNDTVYEYTMSTAWDTNSASYTTGKSLANIISIRIERIRFSTAGDKMFILDFYGDLFEFTLAVL